VYPFSEERLWPSKAIMLQKHPKVQKGLGTLAFRVIGKNGNLTNVLFFFGSTGFEFGALCWLGRCSTPDLKYVF
jgi:hypothetical protein